MREVSRSTTPSRAAFLATLALLAFAASPAAAIAQQIEAPYLDMPTGRINRTGLRVQLDWYGPGHPGYQPVRVKVMTVNGAPSPKDRTLELHLYPYAWSADYHVFDVHRTITLPKGSPSVETTIPIPVVQQLYQFSAATYENGKLLPELTTTSYFSRASQYEESLPSVLIVAPAAPTRAQFNQTNRTSRFIRTAFDEFSIPDFGPMSRAVAGNYFEPIYASESTNTLDYLTYLHSNNTQIAVLHPSDLPERWIELTCYEAIVASWSDLTALRTSRPEAFAAVRDWTQAGHTLIVYGAGEGLAELPAIERELELSRTDWDAGEPPFDQIDVQNVSPSGSEWRRPPRNLRKRNFGVFSSSQGSRGYVAEVTEDGKPVDSGDDDDRKGDKPQPDEFHLAVRPAKFGYVVAIAEEDAMPGTFDDWRWVFNSVPATHWSWNQKHGMSFDDVNVAYWRHRIPGVGIAPVWTFLALITGFAALIGPANYFYLARKRRLALLLATVPIGSLLVIAGLFAYAFFHDGLSVRSRIRSYSIVDSDAERAYSWSWQTYYAGVAPSQGVVLDDSSYLSPMFFAPREAHDDTGRFEIEWEGDTQRLASGYLPSRTMSQFVGASVREGNFRLAVRFPRDGGEPEVENLLGADLTYLVVVGPDGKLFVAPGGVEKEARTKLTALEPEAAAELYDQHLASSPLEVPEGVDVNALRDGRYRGGLLGWLVGNNYMYYGNSGSAPTHVTRTKFEEGIGRLATSLERGTPGLEPGTYFAVAEDPPWLPYAVEDHSREMTLNVIEGRY